MDRVHQTLRIALVMECGVMLLLVVLCQLAGSSMMAWFSDDAVVIEIGVGLLRTLSWNFLAVGIVFGLSGAFQALGNTWPPLIASTSRLLTFALPLVVMHRLAGFSLAQVWRLSVISVLVQALILALLTKILWHNSLRTLSNSATAGARMPTGPWSR
jgi:Na+-driven multidrug efflux pump